MKFECLRCGECCSNLHIETDLSGRVKDKVTLGLFLLPSERKLFPEESIVPLYGAGLKGRSRPRPEVTFAYQILENACPHLTDANLCKIYPKRPIACRAFPVNAENFLDSRCTWVNQNFSDYNIVSRSLLDLSEMEKYRTMIMNHISSYVRYLYMWAYDLKTKKWVRSNF